MAIYFTPASNRYVYSNIANATNIPLDGVWTISLRSKLSHVSPLIGQPENQLGLDLTINVVTSNDRYTLFEMSNNPFYNDMQNSLKEGIYNYQIGIKKADLSFEAYETGVTQVYTNASSEPTKEIVKYTSNNEDNLGFVYYSDTL